MRMIQSATLVAAVMSLAMTTASQAALISGYNFNSTTIATAGTPGSSGVPSSIAASAGSGTLDLSGFGGNVVTFGGTTINAAGTDAAGNALALQGGGATGATTFPGNGTYVTFSFPMTGYQDPIFSLAIQRTGTGFNSDQLSYSTDGTTFTNFGSPIVPPSAFASPVPTIDLSSVNALDGAATVYLRLTLNGDTSTSGNNRLDNVQINATPAATSPEPTSLLALAGAGLIAFKRRKA